jgi:hypothetical protein
MTLDFLATHPTDRAYVVKLHRNALGASGGALAGRVEHLVSGDHADFCSADELVRWLERHADPEPRPHLRKG